MKSEMRCDREKELKSIGELRLTIESWMRCDREKDLKSKMESCVFGF